MTTILVVVIFLWSFPKLAPYASSISRPSKYNSVSLFSEIANKQADCQIQLARLPFVTLLLFYELYSIPFPHNIQLPAQQGIPDIT